MRLRSPGILLLALWWLLFAPVPSRAEARDASDLPSAAPEEVGLDSRRLIELTEWVRTHDVPIFSILISRHGKLVYELYTSSLTREHACYVMSVTKSVVSALVGAAIDRHLIRGPEQPITELLPHAWIHSRQNAARLQRVTVKDVLGMSALNSLDPPRDNSPASQERLAQYWKSSNRVEFVLDLPVLESPGVDFQYNDKTPELAAGILATATHETLIEFANEALFRPMGFQHAEWMHQDELGIENGGYGLRLRPIDLLKFGILYLNGGVWHGHRLLSRSWIERSFTPWEHSSSGQAPPDYGWYWWRFDYGRDWSVHLANGWKGQRLAVIPERDLAVTITGLIEDGSEDAVVAKILTEYVFSAVASDALPRSPENEARLAALLQQVRQGRSRIPARAEPRMVPSVEAKEKWHPLRPFWN